MPSPRERLIVLYRQMYGMTEPECRCTCRCPQSCCSPEYCEDTIRHAKEHWGTTLTPTTHERLPLMGDKGCIAEPHLRPFCTMHTCDVNSVGFKPGDPDWTARYFKLREQIEMLEWETFQKESTCSQS